MLKLQLTKEVDKRKFVPFLIYPENPYYAYWNGLVTVILIFSCSIVPL